jgi:alkylhydroperoxidase/carboxymuconolactone decarboxylase family protein YurZ
MPHIKLSDELPGIVSLFAFRPETAKPMRALAEVLLRGPNTLTSGERELIAHHLGGNEQLILDVKQNFEAAPISAKLKALLAIAGKVQQGGKSVLPADIDRARQEGATDREIHDTVLIAAAFCMYNRYVDGLATWAPRDADAYRQMGARMAEVGYIREDAPAAQAQSTAK